jgi:CHAD domain-containing protein
MNMKTEAIRKVYRSKIKKIAKYYRILTGNFNPDDNHYFRVEVKKLRAFMRLVNFSRGVHEHKIPKPLKKYYRLVGDIRNLQLHQQRIKSLSNDLLIGNPEQYLKGLSEEEKALKKKAKKKKSLSFKDFEKRLLDDTPQELTEEAKTQFAEMNIVRLTQIVMLPIYYDETLHDIRKLIKNLMYNYDYLGEQVNLIIPFPLNDPAFLESLADTLGNFHDLSLAIFFLSTSHLNHASEEKERRMICELKNHLSVRKDNLKNELCDLLMSVKQRLDIQT